KPVAGAEVFLNPNIFGEVKTDPEGRYEFEKIRAGSYTLLARPPARSQPEESKDGLRIAMVTTYYPSATDFSLAQPLSIDPQSGFGDYDIRMQAAPVYRLRGIVTDESGTPAPDTELTLFPVTRTAPEPKVWFMRAGGLSMFATGIQSASSG